MLFLMKKLRWRTTDVSPTGSEVIIPLLMWSWVFEAFLPFVPFFKRLATSDYMDIFSYTVGACAAVLFWTLWYREWPRPNEFRRERPDGRKEVLSTELTPSTRK